MEIFFKIIDGNKIDILLKKGRVLVDHESLTIDRNLDNMLIVSLDKILARNRIDRLSLKSLRIQGKVKPETVSGMVLKSFISALES